MSAARPGGGGRWGGGGWGDSGRGDSGRGAGPGGGRRASRLYGLGLWLLLVGLFDVVGPLGSCGERPRRPRPPEPPEPAVVQSGPAAAGSTAPSAPGSGTLAAAVPPGGRPSDLLAAPPTATPSAATPSTATPSAVTPSAVTPSAAEPGAAADAPALLEYIELHVGGAAPGDAVPLVVAIHGLGDRPEAFSQVLGGFDQPARVLVPRGKRPWGPGFTWFKLASDPGGDRAADVADSAARIVALVKARQAAAPTRGRPMVLGFSQGGILAFWLAAHHPEVFSLAVPIAGLLTPDTWPKPGAVAGSPGASPCKVVALHGEADARIPFADGEATTEAFQRAGYPARFLPFPGVGHTISAPMRLALAEALSEGIRALPAAAPGAPGAP